MGDGLGCKLQIALHDPDRELLVTGPGAVREQGAASGIGGGLRRFHAVFVGRTGPDDIGTFLAQPGGEGLGHRLRQIDHRACPEQPGAGGDREPVVAGAGGHETPADKRVRPVVVLHAFPRLPCDHVGGAQGLEAAEAHAGAFVLHMKAGDTDPIRETGKLHQRRRRMRRTQRQKPPDLMGFGERIPMHVGQSGAAKRVRNHVLHGRHSPDADPACQRASRLAGMWYPAV